VRVSLPLRRRSCLLYLPEHCGARGGEKGGTRQERKLGRYVVLPPAAPGKKKESPLGSRERGGGEAEFSKVDLGV